MATVEDIDTDVTLELDGSGVSPERFQKAVRAFFGVLGEVTKAVCEGRPAVKWRVQVKSGSNLVGVVPVAGFRPELVGVIVGAVHDGIVALEADEVRPDLPQYFGDLAMRHARELSEVWQLIPEKMSG